MRGVVKPTLEVLEDRSVPGALDVSGGWGLEPLDGDIKLDLGSLFKVEKSHRSHTSAPHLPSLPSGFSFQTSSFDVDLGVPAHSSSQSIRPLNDIASNLYEAASAAVERAKSSVRPSSIGAAFLSENYSGRPYNKTYSSGTTITYFGTYNYVMPVYGVDGYVLYTSPVSPSSLVAGSTNLWNLLKAKFPDWTFTQSRTTTSDASLVVRTYTPVSGPGRVGEQFQVDYVRNADSDPQTNKIHWIQVGYDNWNDAGQIIPSQMYIDNNGLHSPP